MKRKIFIIPLLLMLVALASCQGQSKLTDFEQFVKYILDSEQTLIGYDEVNEIKDSGELIFSQITDFELDREDVVKTSVNIQTLQLSANGNGLESSNSTYTTYGDKKYQNIDGNIFEVSYTIPTYYLTFVMQEVYLADNYTLDVDGKDYKLSASVLPSMISSFFLNKSLNGVKDLTIEVQVKNGKLTEFEANFKTKNNNDVRIYTTYDYKVEYKGKNDYVKAVFYVEGGLVKGEADHLIYSYDFKGFNEMKIYEPNVLEEDTITKTGYHIEGWYQTKEEVDGVSVYSNKWDFENDKMPRTGVTLYAKWVKDVTHTYSVCYINKNNEEVKIGSYIVNEGDKFDDFLSYYKKATGYTSLGYLDSNGNKWNNNYKHPGGEEDCDVKVYLDVIEGNYNLVKTVTELNKYKTQNIYLCNDIDLNGKSFNFNKYTGKFLGNGYTISNFNLNYDDTNSGLKTDVTDPEAIDRNTLYISLFYELSKAEIKNVNFADITIDIDTNNSRITNIVFAPFAAVANNSVIENVTISGDLYITKKPENSTLTIVTDKLYYFGSNNTITNSNSGINLD